MGKLGAGLAKWLAAHPRGKGKAVAKAQTTPSVPVPVKKKKKRVVRKAVAMTPQGAMQKAMQVGQQWGAQTNG
jgi:hypothetical protein